MRQLLDYLRLRPLLLVAPPFAAGAAVGSPALAAAAGALGVLAAFRSRTAALALLGLAAGALRAAAVAPAAGPPHEGEIELRGRVAGASHRTHFRRTALADTGDRHLEPARTRFDLDVEEPFRGRVRVQTMEPIAPLDGGEEVRVRGRIHSPRPPSNPGQFDRAAWLARQGIGALLQARDVEIRTGPSGLRSRIQRARRFLRERLDRTGRPEAAALAAAILFGDREGLDDSFALDLQRTGTTHFLAVSGFNVGLVLAAAWAALVLLGAGGRLRTLVLLAAAWGYALLAGLEASVLRAAIMASVWLGAELVGRRADSAVSLAAAALLILAIDPAQVRDVGFQLSFLAVAGILLLVPLLAAFLGGTSTWLQKGYGLVLVSLAAWLATAPVVQSNFHLLTPSVLVTNLLFCPLVLAVMIFGTLAVIVPALGAPLGLAYAALAGLARAITSVPGAYFFVPAVPPALVVVYYAGFAVWGAWTRLRPASWKPLFVPLLVLPLALPAFGHRRPQHVRLAVLDVGRGSCSYVEFADGGNFLFDAGSLDYRDAGATVAAPYLLSRGVFRVDTLFLSHADSDHTNGARSVIDRFRIRRLVVPRGFGDLELLAWARLRGVEVVELERTGDAWMLAPGIEVFAPPVWEKFGREVPDNNRSIVLRVDRRILLTGDIEEEGTEELLTQPDVRAEILVVPHHGKHQRLHDRLLDRVAPKWAVVPGPESWASDRVLRTLRARCATVVVGTTGAFEVELPPGK